MLFVKSLLLCIFMDDARNTYEEFIINVTAGMNSISRDKLLQNDRNEHMTWCKTLRVE